MSATTLTHIAGPALTVGSRYMRQRCAWCGTVLVDHDVELDAEPATWSLGDLVAVSGPVAYLAGVVDGDQLPGSACARIDPAVTL